MKELIQEWREYMQEVGMYHDPNTGRWTDRRAGAVKSLTKAGARRAGVDPKHVERGVVTGKDKIQAKMGSSFGKDQCGRFTLDGEPITPKYQCSDYKKPYAEASGDDDESVLLATPDATELDAWVDDEDVSVDDIIEALVDAYAMQEPVDEQQGDCSKYRGQWMKDLLLSLNKVALASKGELMKKDEGVQKSEYQGSKIDDDKERKTDRRKAADRRRKLRSMVGVYVEPFNRGEKALLTPNSLFHERSLSSNPDKP